MVTVCSCPGFEEHLPCSSASIPLLGVGVWDKVEQWGKTQVKFPLVKLGGGRRYITPKHREPDVVTGGYII